MGSITLEYITELLYISGVKFDRLPKGTRIVLAFCYALIITVCATLNGIYFYVFITIPKLRKPSNIIASSLLFNSIFLLLTAAPLTLLEICNDDIAKKSYCGLSTKIYFFILHLAESY